MISNSATIRRIFYRVKGKKWWHNRIYPKDFHVEIIANGKINLSYKGNSVEVQPIQCLSNQFNNDLAFIVLSGPSISKIDDLSKLENAFSFTVNGSPTLFEANKLTYDAYIVDDPDFIQTKKDLVVHFAKQAQYCFFSYRSIYYLLKAGVNLKELPNIYLFDYYSMPFGKARPDISRAHFSTNLSEGVYVCSTVAYIALQIAYGMGFKEVAVFGLDLSMEGRFYQENNAPAQFLDQDWENGILKPFLELKNIIDQTNWNVWNCSPESRLSDQILKKVDPNHYLCMKKQ